MIRRLKLEGRRVKKEAAGFSKLDAIFEALTRYMKAMSYFCEKYNTKTFPIDQVVTDVENEMKDSGKIVPNDMSLLDSHTRRKAKAIYNKMGISIPISRAGSKEQKEFLHSDVWENNSEEYYDMAALGYDD